MDEYRELDSERVLALDHFSGRGKTSGLEIGQIRTKAAALFHLRDGKVTRLVLYWDRERAFADSASRLRCRSRRCRRRTWRSCGGSTTLRVAGMPRPCWRCTTLRSSWMDPPPDRRIRRRRLPRARWPSDVLPRVARSMDNVEYDFDELIDAGDHVIAVVTRRGRGRASGAEVELRVALVWTLRAGEVVRAVVVPVARRGPRSRRAPGVAMSQENVEMHAGALKRSLGEGRKRWSTSGTPNRALAALGHDPGGRHVSGARSGPRLDEGMGGGVGGDRVHTRGVHRGGRRRRRRRPLRRTRKGSGMRTEGRFWYVFKYRNGRFWRWELWPERTQALEAAGLEE